jgi:Zn finger protein HypA/HybF involved in hydrogenase expression
MTATQRRTLRLAISNAQRAATMPPPEHRCTGCEREVRDHSYTSACKQCSDRRRKRAVRGAAWSDEVAA